MAYEIKTKKNDASVADFVSAVEPAAKRNDCRVLIGLMREITGEDAAMWGGSIIGFGEYRYTYPTGHRGESFLTGFSPRKRNISIYVMAGFDRSDTLMERLGKHKTGKACLYVSSLADIDTDILRQLVSESVSAVREWTQP